MTITYISHGYYDTGGFYLESDLCENTGEYREVRFKGIFRGPAGWLRLFIKAFFAAKGDGFVTVARLVWPVYLRNLFNRKKIILVLHNYDPEDKKPRLYYWLLNSFLRMAARKTGRIAVVVVADYWKGFLQEKFSLSENVFRYPNLFEEEKYRFFADIATKNNKLIHLGQYSEKIDRKAYLLLIYRLEKDGYNCYFSSPHDVGKTDFPVTVFHTREAYLKQMALSSFTVILNSVKEGWNRLAHESFLCGTQVIASGGGGLIELVKQAGGFVVQGPEEAAAVIIHAENLNKPVNLDSLKDFHHSRSQQWFEPIGGWLAGIS